VDELIVLDVDASLNDDDINVEIITDIANECFMPLTIGGGIRTIDDIYRILNAGADKVSINSISLENSSFITKASSVFGSQCIVCSIDVKKINNTYKVFSKSKGLLDIHPLLLAKQYQEYGAGEILLTSVDHEGSTNGYDINLIKLFKDELKIPVILNGGMGEPIHAVEAIQNGADAIAAAYIFHFSEYTPNDIRSEFLKHDISVRVLS